MFILGFMNIHEVISILRTIWTWVCSLMTTPQVHYDHDHGLVIAWSSSPIPSIWHYYVYEVSKYFLSIARQKCITYQQFNVRTFKCVIMFYAILLYVAILTPFQEKKPKTLKDLSGNQCQQRDSLVSVKRKRGGDSLAQLYSQVWQWRCRATLIFIMKFFINM